MAAVAVVEVVLAALMGWLRAFAIATKSMDFPDKFPAFRCMINLIEIKGLLSKLANFTPKFITFCPSFSPGWLAG